MSYESPIRIIENNLTVQLEDNIMTVAKSYGIEVNKDEILKALAYEKGYADGQRDGRTAKAKVNFKDENYYFGWCECGQYQNSRHPYCPACGCRLEWE